MQRVNTIFPITRWWTLPWDWKNRSSSCPSCWRRRSFRFYYGRLQQILYILCLYLILGRRNSAVPFDSILLWSSAVSWARYCPNHSKTERLPSPKWKQILRTSFHAVAPMEGCLNVFVYHITFPVEFTNSLIEAFRTEPKLVQFIYTYPSKLVPTTFWRRDETTAMIVQYYIDKINPH